MKFLQISLTLILSMALFACGLVKNSALNEPQYVVPSEYNHLSDVKICFYGFFEFRDFTYTPHNKDKFREPCNKTLILKGTDKRYLNLLKLINSEMNSSDIFMTNEELSIRIKITNLDGSIIYVAEQGTVYFSNERKVLSKENLKLVKKIVSELFD